MHNPLLDHSNPRVNAIEERLKETIKRNVFEVKRPMKSIFDLTWNFLNLNTKVQKLNIKRVLAK